MCVTSLGFFYFHCAKQYICVVWHGLLSHSSCKTGPHHKCEFEMWMYLPLVLKSWLLYYRLSILAFWTQKREPEDTMNQNWDHKLIKTQFTEIVIMLTVGSFFRSLHKIVFAAGGVSSFLSFRIGFSFRPGSSIYILFNQQTKCFHKNTVKVHSQMLLWYIKHDELPSRMDFHFTINA